MQHAAHMTTPVAALDVESRAAFIWRVYSHVALSILGFAALEMWLFSTGRAESIAIALSGNWLLVLGAFMITGWLATHVALRVESKNLQYLALVGFVIAEAIIFTPMLWIAAVNAPPGTIESAAGVTLLGVAGLTAVAMITRKDFSFLRGILVWGGILAIVGIVSSIIFGFGNLMGTWFSVAMIGFAGAAVLYDTSNILHHYPEDRHVAAALSLFASIAMMFWYVLRLFMARD